MLNVGRDKAEEDNTHTHTKKNIIKYSRIFMAVFAFDVRIACFNMRPNIGYYFFIEIVHISPTAFKAKM